MYGNGDWGRAQTGGSHSIKVWESTELVNWTNQRLLEFALPEYGVFVENEATPGNGEDFHDAKTVFQEVMINLVIKTKELPDTASNLYDYLLIGMILLTLGGFTALYVKKRKMM